MKRTGDELEALSSEIRDDIAEFRREAPADDVMVTVRRRWAESAANEPRATVVRLSSAHKGMFIAAFALASAAALMVAPMASHHAVLPVVEARAQEVSVVLPASGGAWVHLPWNASHHEDHSATVSLDAPGQLAINLPHGAAPACRSPRCVYEWTSHAPHASNPPLRVHIHEPGRYEFRVMHACRQRRVHERFIVLAMR